MMPQVGGWFARAWGFASQRSGGCFFLSSTRMMPQVGGWFASQRSRFCLWPHTTLKRGKENAQTEHSYPSRYSDGGSTHRRMEPRPANPDGGGRGSPVEPPMSPGLAWAVAWTDGHVPQQQCIADEADNTKKQIRDFDDVDQHVRALHEDKPKRT